MKFTPTNQTWMMLAELCFSLFIIKANMNAADAPVSLAFQKADDGGLIFNTGVVKGKLGEKGVRKGFSSMVHIPTGQSMDRSMGIMSIYRVFGDGKRFGTGAWDWPGTIQLEASGEALIQWPAAADRPFAMEARYKWAAPDTADIVIQVSANRDLPKFEAFLSSYFHESFNQCAVLCRTNLPAGSDSNFIAAEKRWGDWLMFPKNDQSVSLIKDGRWQLLPNPVNWTIMPSFAKPIGYRSSTNGISAIFMAPESDCFDLACPHQAEGHYSLYLSLFGRDIKAGETAKARVRMVIAAKNDVKTVEQLYSQWLPR